MRPSKPRLSNKAFSYSSYILVQTVDQTISESFAMAIPDENGKVFHSSVSTLILPAKTPLLLTVGHFMFNLLTASEIKDLFNKKYTKLDPAQIRSKIKFYLYFNEKVSAANESNKENYIELEPFCMLFPKDLAQTYGEVFSAPKNCSNTESMDPKLNKTSDDHPYEPFYKYFTFLVLQPIKTNFLAGKLKEEQILNIGENPVPGQAIFLISSPFALFSPILYKNTVNIVHINKVIQTGYRKIFRGSKQNHFFLVTHCIKEGEEGSPVFNEYSEVIGILMGKIVPNSQETSGVSVCLGISSIVELLSLLSFHHANHDVWKLTVSRFRPFVQSLSLRSLFPRIVKILAGSTLASGVLLNTAGHVLTNKHVVENAKGSAITVEINYNNQSEYEHYEATVFQTSEGNIDIALLKINNKLSEKALKALKMTERFLDHPVDVRYLHGKEVYAIGYTFNESKGLDLRASVTKGHLSKVLVYKNTPFLIATTCPVYNGFSGGAIVSNRGEFLGLITYCSPHGSKGNQNGLNFAYSCNMFKEMIQMMDLRDDENIKGLDIWKMTDGYVEKLAATQSIECVPCFDFKPKL